MKYWEIDDALAIDCTGHVLELVIRDAAIAEVIFNGMIAELSDDVGCGYVRSGYVEIGLDDGGEILEIGDADVAVFPRRTSLGEMLCIALTEPGSDQWRFAATIVDYGSGWQGLNVIGNDSEIEDIFDIDNGVISKR